MNLLRGIARGTTLLLLLGAIASCAEKDLYNSDEDARKSKLPSEDSYFGFQLRGNIPLNVDYAASGFVGNVEVYAEDPLDASGKLKEGITPIYKAFTGNGKISATMYVPTAVKEAYLYTKRMGLPRCVKLTGNANGFSYDANKVVGSRTRAAAAKGVLNDKLPYQLAPEDRVDNMYSLCTWDVNGFPTTANYLSKTSYDMSGLTARVQAFLEKNRVENNGKNENLRIDANKLNITIPDNIDGTKIEVSFVDENGAFQNVFGYYYYKTGSAPTTREDFLNIKKYVIFPNASYDSYDLKCGDTAKLLFFGKDGISTPTEDFPGGYTIGWFLISNGAPGVAPNYSDNIARIPGEYVSIQDQSTRNICLSNEAGDDRQFITLYDETSKLLVVGIEDEFGKTTGDNDFDDVMFCVRTTPEIEGDRPSIPDETPEVKPETETIVGTLAFEDNWPKAGDYDMNDVIIEYKRAITYDKDNKAIKVEESFTPKQKDNAAIYDNVFAYQVDDMGSVTLPAGCEIENGSRSIVITKGVKYLQNQTFTITREFGSSIDKDKVKTDFNPYTIIKGIRGAGRAEVHLPKKSPTDLIDRSKLYSESDAYFIDKDGKYPFAIDIPIVGFIPADETKQIDSAGQYPSFKTWVNSNGSQAADWYLKDKGAK
jgi:hypothetical protein